MKAAVFEQFQHPITIQTVPDPQLDGDGVIISVQATGICRSDWHGWMGHDADVQLPHVLGHELAGIIAAVGKDVRHWQVGDRVTVPFSCGCGTCKQCQAGNQQICDNYFQPGFTAWGSFAELVRIRYADVNLVRLPDGLRFVDAASLGCRFITSFRGVVEQGRVSAGEWVVVHGCGGVGLSAIMIAKSMGAMVIGVDVQADVLAFAQTIGADYVLNAREVVDIPEAIHALTQGGAHLSVDALGSVQTCRNSILSLQKRGRHVQIGLMVAEDADPPLPMGRVIGWELEILGTHGMQAYEYGRLLQMMQHGKLHPEKLVQQTMTLAEGVAFLPKMNQFKHLGVTVIDRL